MNIPITRIPAFLFVVLAACSAPQKTTTTQSAPAIPVSVQGKLYTSVYQQTAAEYKALCFQAYNIAKLRVDAWHPSTKPTAIVTDIDETVLDNSPYDARQALQDKDYDQKTWEEWTEKGQAETVPGALSFLKYAASKGIEVFYITNRYESERTGTLRNLQRFNFPNADNAHLILRQPSTSSSKEQRRQQVLQTHNILMLLGDNLADFSVLYDKKTLDERTQTTQQLASEFGNRFIVLPNPVYGDWESALYRYNYGLSSAQKDSALKAALKTY